MVATPSEMLDLLREIRDNTAETAKDCARIADQTQQIVGNTTATAKDCARIAEQTQEIVDIQSNILSQQRNMSSSPGR